MEERRFFTDAIDRWDVEAIDHVPKYMEGCYLELLIIVKEIEEKLIVEGSSYLVPYLIEGFEQERRHVASTIQCYVKEYGASEKEVGEKPEEIIMIAWKDINQAYLELPVAHTLLMRVVNLTRVMKVLYQYNDGYTFSSGKTKERIKSLFVDPIPLQE
ncbi:(-)-germacrene D synthase-like [Tasmannia lanceolata]|uniref:(-)-germacrene D synthase-like n=1 Tax=Tasmannia lanceolata TaxID=3420 RepID=UPI00406316F1